MGGGVSNMQRWDRHYDTWLACELGNLPVVRRAVDMGTVGVHERNRVTGETLLMVRFLVCVPPPLVSNLPFISFKFLLLSFGFGQIAAREGYIEMVQFLLGAVSVGTGTEGALKGKDELTWADVNAVNRGQQTALMLAVSPAVRRIVAHLWR
jgi:hypothetical protein